MRELLWDYLDGHPSRPWFLQHLAVAGFTAKAASSMVEAADSSGSGPADDGGTGSYTITGTGGDLVTEQLKDAGPGPCSQRHMTHPGENVQSGDRWERLFPGNRAAASRPPAHQSRRGSTTEILAPSIQAPFMGTCS